MKIYFFATILPFIGILSIEAQIPNKQMIADKALFELRKDMPDKTVAMNPVTDFDCPDPSLVKIGKWFYCFKTGYPIKIYRSHT